MRPHLAVSLAGLALFGCNPQSAEADGQFTAFLSVSSSRTLLKEVLNLDGYATAGGEHTQIDCRDPDDFDTLENSDVIPASHPSSAPSAKTALA